VKDVSPNTSTLVVTGDFGGFTPRELFDHWVRPELLVLWWPREAVVDPRVGGEYKFNWPEQNWVLTGTYTAFEPGEHLGFTWAWNHDVDKVGVTQVDVAFEEIEGGSRMTITHGPWNESKDAQDDRQGVREGWIHFGMRLAGLRSGEAT
jgi:uncharacterized protein YndB with AHSA1/START domain